MDRELWLERAKSLRSLRAVLEWASRQSPPFEVVDVVAQDEFTYDVLVRVAPNVVLSFDTT